MDDIIIENVIETNRKEAKKQIMDYFRKHKTAWVSEIVENLKLDLELVCDILNELEKEGKLKENPTIV